MNHARIAVAATLAALALGGCASTGTGSPGGGAVEVPASQAPSAAPSKAASGGLEDGSFTSTPPKIADQFGSLSGTARVTNTSDKEKSATFTYTVFKGADQVGTLSGVANTLGAGKVATVTLVSTDKFMDGPYKIEFQVDAEF